MEIRAPTDDDTRRIRELVDSAVTTTYRLSPQQIDVMTDDLFSEDRLTDAFEGDDTITRVADTGDDVDGSVVVGYAEGTRRDGTGELRWLFVDPEHRGKGIGSELFETIADELHSGDVDDVRVITLEANTEGGQFAERFGFERVDEQTVEIGGESLVEHVHAETSAEVDSEERSSASKSEAGDGDLPNTERRDGETITTTDDGRELVLDRDEGASGTEATFFAAYDADDHSERVGFYCGNCGTLEASMDQIGRIECGNCGNTHAPRTSDAYDGSYL